MFVIIHVLITCIIVVTKLITSIKLIQFPLCKKFFKNYLLSYTLVNYIINIQIPLCTNKNDTGTNCFHKS